MTTPEDHDSPTDEVEDASELEDLAPEDDDEVTGGQQMQDSFWNSGDWSR